MLPLSTRAVVKVSIAAALSAILYQYWLSMSVLHYLSVNQWRAVAIAMAVAVGTIWVLCRWGLSALVCGFIVGLLVGGTWAEWQFPQDVQRSLDDAFASHWESFWRDMILLTVAVTGSGFCSARLAKSRS